MVAENAVSLPNASPKKLVGRAAEIPFLTKLQAKNFYLFDGLSLEAIAQKLGRDAKTWAGVATREGWIKERKRRESLISQKSDSRLADQASAVADAIASQSEELALSALGNVRSALERCDKDAAKDSQAYSATVKNLASTARLMRETGSVAEKPQLNLNLFFAAAQKPGEKNVTGSGDQSAGVIETEATKL